MDEYEALRLAISKVAGASGMGITWTEGRPDQVRKDDALCLSLGRQSAKRQCTLLRQPLPSEGNRVTINFLDVGDGPEGVPAGTWVWLGAWVRDLARMRRREQALMDAGYARTDAPHWSVTVHPAIALMASTIGMDIKEYFSRFEWRTAPEGWRGEPDGSDSRLDGHILVRAADSVFAERFCRSGRKRTSIGEMEYSDAPRRQGAPTLQIMSDSILPDSIVQGATGCDLRDVVDLGSAGTAPTTRIASISQATVGNENQIKIELEVDAMPIADPPIGITRDWLAGTN